MRRILIAALCALLLSLGVFAADAEITALDAVVTVRADGSSAVTLTADVSFAASPGSFVIPLGADAEDISLQGWDYDTTEIGAVTALRISGAALQGEQRFVCSFTLPCAVENTDTGQSFLLRLPEAGWAYAIKSYRLQVTFPAAVENMPTWVSGYGGDVADNYLAITIAENVVTATNTADLLDHETMTMQLRFPADTFDLRHQPGKTAAFDKILFFLLFAAAPIYWFFRLRYGLILPRQQQSIDMEATAGEIPCQISGEAPDAFGMLAHWGNLGYLSIYRNRRGRIIVRKHMEMGNERKPAERRLFYGIFRSGDACDAQSLRFRAAVKGAREQIISGWNRRLFSGKSGSPLLLRAMGLLAGGAMSLLLFDRLLPATASRWVFLPILTLLGCAMCALVQHATLSIYRRRRWLAFGLGGASALTLLLLAGAASCSGLMLLNLLLQGFCALTTIFGGKRSDAGTDRLRRLLGLRSFLRRADQGALQRLTYLDAQYFYRMLPFAEALGVGYAFSKHFGSLMPESCAWLSDAYTAPNSHAAFYALYAEIASAVRGEYYRKQTVQPAPQQPMREEVQSREAVAPLGQRPHRRYEEES
ncbi:MAG: DUF2207 domain-containing protein [Oscillospiraceae bacterium]|jgi:hypothetical protein|nr:DUF2207 domain-containing protein [Oscillospiraceae bacterium]